MRTYTYDNSGQLITASGKEAGGVTNRLQEQLGYLYDPAGNLKHRTNNALLESFSVNSVNELTVELRSGTMTVEGTTTGPATNVTVNGTNTATLYADNTFAATSFSPANGNNTYTAVAKDAYGRRSTNSTTCFLPTSNNYLYDNNGNLLTDSGNYPTSSGVRNFAYDDENQLTAVWVSNVWQSTFVYDGKMRRRIRKEYTWQGGAWVETNEVHYIYDGNVVIQERDILNFPQVTYTRGIDLSGKLQGAGGIGGLLARTDNHLSAINSPLSTSFYHCDGNGNITCLINAFQSVAARYLYDPFGNILSQSGPLAGVNLYCFSSKEYHPNSGLIYYGYRFYDPNLQRWLNRDPIKESGGLNLYEFVANQSISTVDSWGLAGPVHDCKDNPALDLQCFLECQNQGGVKSCSYTQDTVWNGTGGDYSYSMNCQCNGTQQPPCPPRVPVPRPNPRRGGNPPSWFWPVVGGGIVVVGIGVGCTLCPECCVIGILVGA